MNCGLTNLAGIKGYLLGDTPDARFHGVLQTIGRGVATALERACNRKFAYAADTLIVTGDRDYVVVPRYPINNTEDMIVATRAAESEAWVTVTGEPMLVTPAAGMMRMAGSLGGALAQAQITWTGGYWFETLDAEEAGYPGTIPEGATALPNDLLLAFFMQCEQVWLTHDKLGTEVVGGGAGSNFLNTRLSTIEIVPAVKEILRGYIRY
jgi:hypothetical protein